MPAPDADESSQTPSAEVDSRPELVIKMHPFLRLIYTPGGPEALAKVFGVDHCSDCGRNWGPIDRPG
jgi:hypothetical protein